MSFAVKRDLPELICDTSPLQYLHQLRRMDFLRALAEAVIIPPSVVAELDAGRRAGIDLPELDSSFVVVHKPERTQNPFPTLNLGDGEIGVLSLGLESRNRIVVIDDGLARRAATALDLKLTGTMGILLDAKKMGLIPTVAPELERLEQLRFRISPRTKRAVLLLAAERD